MGKEKNELANTNQGSVEMIKNEGNTAQLIKDSQESLAVAIGTNVNNFLKNTILNDPKVYELATIIQNTYKFSPIGTSMDHSYLSEIITIKDFKDHPEKYLHKLTKGIGSFPIDINYSLLSERLFDTAFGINGKGIFFQHSSWIGMHNNKLGLALKIALEKAKLGNETSDSYIYIEHFNFLKNYDKLVQLVLDQKMNEGLISYCLSCLKLYKLCILSILHLTLNTHIKSPRELIDSTQEINGNNINNENPYLAGDQKEIDAMKKLKKLILNTSNGTHIDDIGKLLKIQNPDQFILLIEELINYVIKKGLFKITTKENKIKRLDDYSSSELISFSCFLSRFVIEDYQKIQDLIGKAFSGIPIKEISGKCSDYTGLSLYIIKLYFQSKYPEKFKGLYIGFNKETYGLEYRHCFIKIYKKNKFGGVDICFMDPTLLSKGNINNIKNPKKIFELADTSNLPIVIDRSAENLIIAKINKVKQVRGFIKKLLTQKTL